MESSGDMEMVETVHCSFVAPNEETPKERLWLSNLDLVMRPHYYTPIIYLYIPPEGKCNADVEEFFSVTTIEKALAIALVPFYPLAGRFGTDGDGRREINCNGEGALFVVARSKLTRHHFHDFKPSTKNRNLFVPVVDSNCAVPLLPLLMLQMTYLSCGSVVLGLAFNHCVVDAHSDFHFMQALTNIAKGNSSIVPAPSINRTLIRARSPPLSPSKRQAYAARTKSESLGHTSKEISPPFVSTILKLSQCQINYLKSQCSSNKSTDSAAVSTFQAVSAHIWKVFCVARGLAHDKESRLIFSIGIRSRMSPPLPEYFFGNGCTSGEATARVSEVIGFIPERIREAIGQVDDAYIRAYIDDLEVADKDRVMNWIPMTESDILIASWLGMPCYDADFGYGKPVFVSRAETGLTGVAVLINNPGKDKALLLLLSPGSVCLYSSHGDLPYHHCSIGGCM
ncbi:hypothetical protein LUZ63_018894 [Rhynchospora breviuscula]|uniref:Uncharacterized protein n=1 Tax=Rhynchospora breviuscula TaxID=2022672 RepID=A0A9Q0C577_9POAL|nr:hypothetical protein LUZ63_018894 [Rhynchospora breviuscula]